MVYSVLYLLVSLSPISIKNIATGIQCFVTDFLDGIQCDISVIYYDIYIC
jgi:hypothetical protein